jgi:hypothetical protein
MLRGLTITAKLFRRQTNFIAEFCRDSAHFKSSGEVIKPRLTASAIP